MKKLILIITLCSLNTVAGQEGGGGMAVQNGTQYILYDFIEAGLDTNASLPQLPDAMGSLPVLNQNLPFSADVIAGMSSMLNLVFQKHPTAANEILRTLKKYVWQLPAQEIVNAKDIGRTPVVLSNGITAVPVAIRDDNAKVVWVRRTIWDNMSLFNRVGLLFHEVLYAISVLDNKESNSYGARTVNGLIFNANFVNQDFEKINGVFKLVFAQKNVLTPEQYAFFTSDQFKNKCDQTVAEAMKLFALADSTFSSFALKMKNELIKAKNRSHYCTNYYEGSLSLEVKKIKDQLFTLPASGELRANYIYHVAGFWIPSLAYECYYETKKELYSLSKEEIAQFRNIHETAKKILSVNSNELLGRCLGADVSDALNGIDNVKVP